MSTLQTTILKHPDSATNNIQVDSSGNTGLGGSGNLLSNNTRTTLSLNNTGSSAVALGVNGTREGHIFADANSMEVSSTDNYMYFTTGNTESVRITDGGFVGINDSTPSCFLDIKPSAVDTDIFAIGRQDHGSIKLFRIFQDSNVGQGTGACHVSTSNRDLIITASTDAAIADGIYLKSNGDFLIGTATTFNATDSSNVEGNILGFINGRLNIQSLTEGIAIKRHSGNGRVMAFSRGGQGLVGSITVTTSATSFNTSSDYRLKENLVNLTGAITRVKTLPVYRFNFIADADTTVDGFIAHEAQAVVPEAVTGTKDEVDDDGNAVMQGIDQSKFVPLLTAALQEAIAKIETLESKVAALEAG